VIAQALVCPKCRTPIPETLFNLGRFAPCLKCRQELQVDVFPAFYAGPRLGRPGEPLVDASEASCFFHTEKRAAIACESCGRFLCGLCDLEVEGRHICPSCLSAGRKKGALKNLDQYRLVWPGIGLLMALVLPLIFYPLTPIWALASLGVTCFGFFRPGSITGDRKIVLYALAFVVPLAELALSFFLGKNLLLQFSGGSTPFTLP
jgi:hypothetical protein